MFLGRGIKDEKQAIDIKCENWRRTIMDSLGKRRIEREEMDIIEIIEKMLKSQLHWAEHDIEEIRAHFKPA